MENLGIIGELLFNVRGIGSGIFFLGIRIDFGCFFWGIFFLLFMMLVFGVLFSVWFCDWEECWWFFRWVVEFRIVCIWNIVECEWMGVMVFVGMVCVMIVVMGVFGCLC